MELTTLTEYIHVDCITTNPILKPVVLNYIQDYNSIAKLQVVCALFYISVDRVTIILYIPPQTKGRSPHEFVGQSMKPRRWQSFSEYISQLIQGRNVLDNHISIQHLFSDKMIINLYMFHASMKDRIWGQSKGQNVITP